MTPAISILIPHLREPDNDAALKVAVDCIIANTDLDYELIIEAVEARRDIYPVLNDLARRAKSDWIVYSNTDVFMAPGWAAPMYDGRDENAIVTGVIAECGAIGVNSINYELHYGRTPATFDRVGFEAWILANGAEIYSHKAQQHRGWYLPCLLHRPTFLDFGGFDLARGEFPAEPVDEYTWDKWATEGKQFHRVNSWSYHLQNYSSDDPVRMATREHG